MLNFHISRDVRNLLNFNNKNFSIYGICTNILTVLSTLPGLLDLPNNLYSNALYYGYMYVHCWTVACTYTCSVLHCELHPETESYTCTRIVYAVCMPLTIMPCTMHPHYHREKAKDTQT